MKSRDVVIGMKVVPHSKSDSRLGLDGSVVWNRAKEMNQPYLYVHGWNSDYKVWFLAEIPYSRLCTGDFFLSKDFEPYVEDV